MRSIAASVVAVNIRRDYRPGMSAEELYECTRGVWRLTRTRAEQANYVFAVVDGRVIEVYEPTEWAPAGTTPYRFRTFDAVDLVGRYEFVGRVAGDSFAAEHRGQETSIRHTQNPVRYVNC